MKKRTIIHLLFAMIMAFSPLSFAAVSYDLAEFSDDGDISIVAGPVVIDNNTYFKLGINPDFNFGPLEIGLDINAFLGDNTPSDLQSIALRRVAYDHNKHAGIEWGRLRNVTFGFGLLIDNYDSGSFGSSEFSSEKAGLKTYASFDAFRIDAMYTASELAAGRITYQFEDSPFFDSPLVLGATYVDDTNGIDEVYESERIFRPERSGFAVDASLPIGGEFLTAYVEYAQLLENDDAGLDDAKGAATGIKGDFLNILGYTFEYRRLGTGFVPSYFNDIYEGTSFNPSSLPNHAINGFLGYVYYTFANNIKASVQYEAYEDVAPILSGAVGWKRLGQTSGVVNYLRSFNDSNNGILQSDILYRTGGAFDYIVRYKRIFLSSDGDDDIETYSIGIQMSADAFLSSLPFVN